MTTTPDTFKLVVAGGGTGGHTYPALTTIRAVERLLGNRGTTVSTTWIGVASGLEARVTDEQGIPFVPIITGKFRRTRDFRSIRRNVADLFRIPVGIVQAIIAVFRARPDAVLTTGGYVAVPVGIAARLLRRRLVVHEQITTLGLANRLLTRLATDVAVSHASTVENLPKRARFRATLTGNPIRPELFTGDPAQARALFGLEPALPLVYVTGGAQGSAQINRMVSEALPTVLPRCQIVHQCGPTAADEANAVRASLPPHLAQRYTVAGYVGAELPHLLAAADLVISRAGAGTIAELTALGKPSILVPLIPTGGDEQRRNARHLAEAGAAVDLAGDDATGTRLGHALVAMLDSPDQLTLMGKNAAELGHPNAATELAALVVGPDGL